MNDNDQVIRICERINEIGSQRHAGRLWDAIDSTESPEEGWAIMLDIIPWAFGEGCECDMMRQTADSIWVLEVMEFAGMTVVKQ